MICSMLVNVNRQKGEPLPLDYFNVYKEKSKPKEVELTDDLFEKMDKYEVQEVKVNG